MHNYLAMCGVGGGVCVAFSCSKVIVVTLRPWAKGVNQNVDSLRIMVNVKTFCNDTYLDLSHLSRDFS